MPDVEINIGLACGACGSGLDGNAKTDRYNNLPYFDVFPCEKCIDRANNKGFEEGHEKGYDEGKQAEAYQRENNAI